MKDFFPPSCKQHTLHQLTKKGNKELYTNYRPTSLLSYVGKTLEKKCVYRHVSDYLNANQIIAQSQSGFTPGTQCLKLQNINGMKVLYGGSEILSTFLKQPSQTVSVKPTQWQGADGENRRRRRTLKREGHRTAFTSICDSTDKELIQDQRIMKLAD